MDLLISGICEITLEGAINKMFSVDAFAPISKVVVWDNFGKANQTFFNEGTSFSDSNGIIEYNCKSIYRVSFLLNPQIGNIRTIVEISMYADKTAVKIEGQLYITQLINHYTNNKKLINDLAFFIVLIADLLNSTFINVSDEDDESLILKKEGILLPSLLGIFNKSLLYNNEGELERLGLRIISFNEYNNYKIIIINPNFEPFNIIKVNQEVLAFFRKVISQVGCIPCTKQ